MCERAHVYTYIRIHIIYMDVYVCAYKYLTQKYFLWCVDIYIYTWLCMRLESSELQIILRMKNIRVRACVRAYVFPLINQILFECLWQSNIARSLTHTHTHALTHSKIRLHYKTIEFRQSFNNFSYFDWWKMSNESENEAKCNKYRMNRWKRKEKRERKSKQAWLFVAYIWCGIA